MSEKDGTSQRTELEKFELWRNNTITDYENKCAESSEYTSEELEKAKEDFNKFSRCMIQLTRQMCNCDQDCLSKSFKKVHYNSVCPKLDTTNLFVARKYLNCDNYGIRIIGGKMHNEDEDIRCSLFSKNIENAMLQLCNNKENSYNKLQCFGYELKNKCVSDMSCIEQNIPSIHFYNCVNDEFEQQLEDIESTLDFEGLSSKVIELKISENVDQRSARNSRSLDYLNDVQTTSDLKELKSDYNLTAESTCYISVSAFIILGLGYLFFKNHKKAVKNNLKQDLENN